MVTNDAVFELAEPPDPSHPLHQSFLAWRHETKNYVDDESLLWQTFLAGAHFATEMLKGQLISQGYAVVDDVLHWDQKR